MSDKGAFGRCDICGSDHPGISNFLMGCPSQYHTLIDPITHERLKELITDVYSELTCIESAHCANDQDAIHYHYIRAMNKIGDPRNL